MIRRGKASKATKRPSRRKASAKPDRSNKRSDAPSPFEDEWEAFKGLVSSKVQSSKTPPPGKKPAPYDKPDAVLKRTVYEFVRRHRPSKRYKHIETAITNDRDSGRALRVKFADNPFHWVLGGLKDHVDIIERYDITRSGRQLLYADRHDVEPHFLIGFLYQSGDPNEICRKAKRPSQFEDWYLSKLKDGDAEV